MNSGQARSTANAAGAACARGVAQRRFTPALGNHAQRRMLPHDAAFDASDQSISTRNFLQRRLPGGFRRVRLVLVAALLLTIPLLLDRGTRVQEADNEVTGVTLTSPNWRGPPQSQDAISNALRILPGRPAPRTAKLPHTDRT